LILLTKRISALTVFYNWDKHKKMRKVLLVEDSATQAAKTRLDLEARGFMVEVACDGTSALSRVEQWQPDVIILDYLLPDINGIEVCRTLKRNPIYRTIPIVVFSIENKLRNMTMAYSAGADSYVVKGREGESILEILIDTILARRNHRWNYN
jgi:two-component system phosphate regulon response regulator PhoB